MTLDPVRTLPTYACIIRATWERGTAQREALVELLRRGTWLTAEQRAQGGISEDAYYWARVEANTLREGEP